MAKLSILGGATSVTVNLFIQDSSSTTGAGLTGLVFNTSSLVAYYALPKAAAVSITLATLAAVTSAYSSGGFKEIDATNMPGWYRFDVPNAALVGSNRFVSIHFKGATNMAPLPLEIELTGWDNQDGVRGGMTALPNAVAQTAGGLPTVGTGASQIDLDASGRVNVGKWLGTLVTAATAGIPDVNAKNINNVSTSAITTINANLGTTQPINFTGTAGTAFIKVDVIDISGAAVSTTTAQLGVNVVTFKGSSLTARDIGASVLLSSGTGTGQLDFTSGVVKANLVQILGTALTETAGQIAAGFKQFFNVAAPASTMELVTAVGTVTNLTNAPISGDFTATMKTSLNAATPASVVGAVGSVTGNVGGNVVGNVNGNVVGSVASVTARVTANTDQFAGQTVTAAAGVTLPSSVASPTNITAGTITTATNLTNAPTSGDFTAVMKTSLNAATPTTTLSPAGVQAIWDALTNALTTVGSIGRLLVTNIDATISSRSTYAGADTPGTTTLLTRVPGTVQPQTGDSFARLGAPSGASVSADIAQIETNVVAIPTANANADALLKRDWTSVTGEAARSALNALRTLRNKVTVAAGTLTVYKEDGTTPAFTETVTTDPAAEPIVSVAP